MSALVENAIADLDAKAKNSDLDKSVKFTIADEGSIVVDATGARASDEETDLTVTADAETFKGIMDGSVNSTSAFMSGKIKIDGDMGLAMRLGEILG